MFTKREHKIYKTLKCLQLSDQEVYFIINKNKTLEKYFCSDMKKIMDELRKYGYTQEQIIKLIMKKQHLFNYSIKDFTALVNEVLINEKCLINEAIEKYL